MKTRIAAVAAFAGSLLLIPIALDSANAGRGGGFGGGMGGVHFGGGGIAGRIERDGTSVEAVSDILVKVTSAE